MPERLVVIGGDAGGMAAASQARRRDPSLDIVAFEKGRWTSYSACGIPYVVSGAIPSIDRLIVRRAQVFRDEFRVDVRLEHEVTAIDLDARKVEVRDHAHGRTLSLGFDVLMIGTGSRPARPPLPGIEGELVHGVQTLDDADHLLRHAASIECRDVVVVGAGYIGLEIAEAFLQRGSRVTVIEASHQVMRTLDPDMASLVEAAMRRHGVDLRLGVEVHGFEGNGVVTAGGVVPADLVVLGLGVTPNTEIAAAAGIKLGVRNAIRVTPRQHTSADGVWAAGDCCESFHLVSRRQVHIALGTVANKQSRVAGINIGGGYATFPGVVGTAVTKVCSTEVARSGLNEQEAAAAGLGYVVGKIESTTRARYYPGTKPLTVKLLAERGSGRLLGGQIVGEEGAAKRIDIVATALTAGMTMVDLIDLDLGYAPPFSPLWDPIQVAARRAAEAVDGSR